MLKLEDIDTRQKKDTCHVFYGGTSIWSKLCYHGDPKLNGDRLFGSNIIITSRSQEP